MPGKIHTEKYDRLVEHLKREGKVDNPHAVAMAALGREEAITAPHRSDKAEKAGAMPHAPSPGHTMPPDPKSNKIESDMERLANMQAGTAPQTAKEANKEDGDGAEKSMAGSLRDWLRKAEGEEGESDGGEGEDSEDDDKQSKMEQRIAAETGDVDPATEEAKEKREEAMDKAVHRGRADYHNLPKFKEPNIFKERKESPLPHAVNTRRAAHPRAVNPATKVQRKIPMPVPTRGQAAHASIETTRPKGSPALEAQMFSKAALPSWMDDIQTPAERKAIRKALPFSSVGILQGLLARLQAMRDCYQSLHWSASGSPAYGDHLLFQRLYEALVEEVDSMAEKIVGLSGMPEVVSARNLDAARADVTASMDLSVAGMLMAERQFCEGVIPGVLGALEGVGLSEGLENFLQGMADTHEGHVYLLQQRSMGGLSKAGTGEGSRGGHIIGHTASGKPIYGEKKPNLRTAIAAAMHSHPATKAAYEASKHAYDKASFQRDTGPLEHAAAAHAKAASTHPAGSFMRQTHEKAAKQNAHYAKQLGATIRANDATAANPKSASEHKKAASLHRVAASLTSEGTSQHDHHVEQADMHEAAARR